MFLDWLYKSKYLDCLHLKRYLINQWFIEKLKHFTPVAPITSKHFKSHKIHYIHFWRIDSQPYIHIFICNQGPKAQQKLSYLDHLIFKKPTTDNGNFNSSNHQKWLPSQILGGKTVKNVPTDPQTTELWTKKRNVPWVR